MESINPIDACGEVLPAPHDTLLLLQTLKVWNNESFTIRAYECYSRRANAAYLPILGI